MSQVNLGTWSVTSKVMGIKILTLFKTYNDLYLILIYSVLRKNVGLELNIS
jgi:hypothetical protein